MAATARKKSETAQDTLKRVFGFDSFQDCQEQSIHELELGKNVLVIVRTGGGKSLIYQIVGIRRTGLTIVISPLISLMHDQVGSLRNRKVNAVVIDSGVSPANRKKIWAQVRSGKVKFLYVSPEQLSNESFYKELGDTDVSLLVVDEAHCIAMWGHDFRREYLDIPRFRKRLGMPQLLACTATAPLHVRNEILENLEITDAEQIIGDLDRPNLIHSVQGFSSTYEKLAWLLPRLRENSASGERTIVYCRRVRTVEELALECAGRKGISFGVYHGQLEDEERKAADQKFRAGLTPILLATKAVGMGWNVENIREVYHFDPPESIDELWQEMGRAGRDGHRAWCYTLFQNQDIHQLFRFIRVAHPTMEQLTSMWGRICKLMPREAWKQRYPEGFFYEEKFIREYEEYCGDGSGNLARTCIARFCEYRLIRIDGTKIVFLMKPDEVAKKGFPFSAREIGTRREAAILQLKIMLHFLTNAGDNPRRLIMEYFNLNTLVDHVKELDLEKWYVPEQDCLKTILLAVAERDMQPTELNSCLRGVGGVGSPYSGQLRTRSIEELGTDIAQAINLGYLRLFALDDRSFLTIAKPGREHLAELGFSLEADVKYVNLKRRMHNPANKPLLRSALEAWWLCNRGRHSPERWWRIIEEFLEEPIEILDRAGPTKLTGMELAADFCHKKPIMKRAKYQNSDGTGKVGAGLRLTDAKLFLNYLFNNAIET